MYDDHGGNQLWADSGYPTRFYIICSLFYKTLSLYAILKQYNIDIFTINETWLNYNITNASLYIPGYHIIRLDRPTSHGGIAILVANQYKSVIENTIISHSIELLHVALELPYSKPINIISVYHPPGSSMLTFLILFINFYPILIILIYH